MSPRIPDGVIDVHAHWLPRALFVLPPGAPYGPLNDRDGQLHLGDLPLSIATDAMSDAVAITEDMDRAGVAVRVLSAPPFAFPLTGAGAEYAVAFNTALADVVGKSEGRFLGLGIVALGEPQDITSQLTALRGTAGIVGVAIPPVVDGDSLHRGALRHIVSEAARLDLAVLVHPMQIGRPEWSDYYLANLIGNPVETATAVANLVLSGLKDDLPALRICFLHGGGCAPGLLGRWDHGWRARADVRAAGSRLPSDVVAELYFDTVTHDAPQLELLRKVAGKDKVVCGSDYPFDMAESDPVRFAVKYGPDEDALTRAARTFLGVN
ncbi:amidohydrolase family protein [Mycolicibacterium phocaicum]|uniref:2-hydroxy-3-carboxy-6-oxo-7-methylocta-2, 4-dienoate decarboxylase n=1 Tax=Mycolicibacterium phocaicum TaxID=319706 RepID=A0A7I7ZWU5_9MYCO|nr:amidohydrolase family protein [Mycolicibacterium phocaicum]TLH64203.1 2-hydroxy-3-carboxy-6-oxo-7-methylocta-2,4-dienoate decarboxylase [Mycolicibacterium phocaicum]BBZ58199.1 2-hydroxy-3-carboxy-6-oxo-7-methylocta-2,4-dienoa te decarboxylase [Mycolicibacterium phocaicum]